MTTGGEDFADRLSDARAGDPSAWVSIYDLVAPVVLAYLRAQSLPDPEDVAGETLLQVVRDLDRFTGSERQFVSWTLSIAHHRMLDARRALQRRPATPRPAHELPERGDEQDGTASAVLADTEWDTVADLLGTLTPLQREVVALRVAGGLSLEEVATVVGCTVGAVKGLQHRAFYALREQLATTRNPDARADAHPV